jgi:ABC-type phosphate transport system substrate-binding protein
MRTQLTILSIAVALAMTIAPAPPAAVADDEPTIIVIVHPKSSVTRLDRKFLANAFLKKKTRWSDDTAIRPVDLASSSAVRREFSERFLGRTVTKVRRYWNQVVFSGRGVPPPELDSEAEVVEYVTTHKGAIGYVSDQADLDGAKVVQVR